MHQVFQPNPQRLEHRDYLSNHRCSCSILNVVGVLGATVGTTVMLIAAFGSQPINTIKTKTASAQQIISHRESLNLKLKPNQDNHTLTPTPHCLTSESCLTPPFFKKVEVGEEPDVALKNNNDIRLQSLFTDRAVRQISLPLIDFQERRSHIPMKLANLEQAHTTTSLVSVALQTSLELALELATSLQKHQTTAVAEVHSQIPLQQVQPNQPAVETPTTPSQLESTPTRQEIKLNLSDLVILALENNRPIKNAYLERIAQRQELAVEEDKFVPDFTPTVSVSLAQFGSNEVTGDGDVGLEATVKLPTGGQISFAWAANSQTSSLNDFDSDTNGDRLGQNLQLSFNQPLLRGAGIDVNRASIDVARLTEEFNILDLKSTLINTITDAIIAYRELLLAQERLKIAQLSLESAKETLEFSQVLIDAGRLAPVDIVQSETDVANAQVRLVEAENNLEARRLALLEILDIDQNVAIIPSETPTASPVTLNLDNLRQLAFKNQPDYLKAQVDLERTTLNLLQAENNRLWDLSLNTSYNDGSRSSSDIRTRLVFSRQLGDLTIERDFQRSRVNQLQAENTLEDRQASLEIQVRDRVRDADLSFSQVELARKATELSERQLEIALEKQRLGSEDITIFQIIDFQNALVQARNAELDATINYLNALTRLDQTVGTTLETWQVKLETD